ncbi:sodium channel protein 1 brain-like isoform X2 [Nematostella vectensis]|uniref:sodium channel protein 1 brain-like isoform X2 n=1 Tax=Nematostella vectensis TaxID=45351 RepID=UPI0020771881|nr:sodium channel protein 1 brain-like isoform X2 [Nematostella vectensis]
MFLRYNPALSSQPVRRNNGQNRRPGERNSPLNPIRNAPGRPLKLPSLYPAVSLNSLSSNSAQGSEVEHHLRIGNRDIAYSGNTSPNGSVSSVKCEHTGEERSVYETQLSPKPSERVKGTPVVLGAGSIIRATTIAAGSPIACTAAQHVEDKIEIPECKTFVVVASRFGKQYVYRFSKEKSLCLFGPLHPFRKAVIVCITNQFFEFFILLTIIVNCIFLAIKNAPEEPEYVFAAIYTIEMFLKIIAKGFLFHEYAYLRDPWNWLDFVVVFLGYVTLIPNVANLSGIRTFRVLRALRTISAVEGLKTMVNALLKSMKMLSDVLILTTFFLCIFALVGMQLFVGALRNKCVLKLPQNLTTEFSSYISNSTYWYIDRSSSTPLVCGNYSTASQCPSNYTCMPGVGENPNYGFTSFDNFGWALITAFQLVTMDFWENVYNYVLSALGSWYVIYFATVIFFGSFYLLNLVLAVVAVSYQQEVVSLQDREQLYNDLKGIASSYSFHGRAVPRLLLNGKTKTISLASKCKLSFCMPCFAMPPSKTETSHASDVESSHAALPSHNEPGSTIIELNHLENNNESRTTRTESLQSPSLISPAKDNNVQIGFLSSGSNSNGDVSPQSPTPSGEGETSFVTLRPVEMRPSFIRKLSAISEQSTQEAKNRRTEEGRVNGSRSSSPYSRGRVLSRRKSSKGRSKHWARVQDRVNKMIMDPLFDTFITGCIVLNTMFLTVEYHNMNSALRLALEIGNKVFTTIFLLEMVFKLMAFGCRGYIKSRWNIFDGFIVTISIVDLIAEAATHGYDSGLSVLRTFRLLRVFKLAQSWRTMNMLLSTIARSVGQLGNLTLVLGIVVYMLAVVGMQIFEQHYTPAKFYGRIPRWNFTDFWHSFMMIFRVLCGEWIEPLHDCMRVTNPVSSIFFLTALVIGNFLVLNLFLALLLNAFARESLEEKEKKTEKPSRFKKGVKRISRALKLSNNVSKRTQVLPTIRVEQDGEDAAPQAPNGSTATNSLSNSSSIISAVQAFQAGTKKGKINRDTMKKLSIALETAKRDDAAKETYLTMATNPSPSASFTLRDGPAGDEAMTEVDECCPWCMQRCACAWVTKWKMTQGYRAWRAARLNVKKFVEHKYFEWGILMIIFASSFALVFEDVHLPRRPILKKALDYLNILFAVVFTAEFLLKLFGLGVVTYFKNLWNCLDVLIVVISLATVISNETTSDGDSNLSAFRSLRTLRALRPLRAISRWEGMKVVVNSLLFAIPGIGNVLLVCLVFWLIFSIMGVQFFGGRFFKCVDAQGERVDYNIVSNKSDCISLGYRWVNSKINFDNSLNGFLALFQVATFEGWIEIMRDAVDARGFDQQPSYEYNFAAYAYFVVFIIVGSFFTLNLFIGVIIDNFNRLKKQYEDYGALDIFLTPSQKAWFSTLRKAANKKPKKMISRPKNKWLALLFDAIHSSRFETLIMVMICLNIIVMMIQHYRQQHDVEVAMMIINLIFTGVFTLEAVLRIIALRQHYFKQPWNIFDFTIVLLSILGIILEYLQYDLFITPSLFRVARVFRIGRLLRFYKGARGIRRLLFALVISLPALFNIGALLFLVMFIYSIIGMSSFGYVRKTGALDNVVNFETFGSSMLLLFRLSTSAGWNDVLNPLLAEPPDCDPTYEGLPNGDCGTPWLAHIYFTSFILLTFLIIINMYIAIILENLSQAHQQEEVGITDDDLDMFYMQWELFDPGATQYIPYSALSEFVDGLDQPLRIPQPNKFACINLNIPIKQGDRVHCFDVMQALVRRVIGDIEEEPQATTSVAYALMKTKMEQHFVSAFPKRAKTLTKSTTLRRIQEERAASIIQKCYRQYRLQRELRRYRIERSHESVHTPNDHRRSSTRSEHSAQRRYSNEHSPSRKRRNSDNHGHKKHSLTGVSLPSVVEVKVKPASQSAEENESDVTEVRA